MTQLFYLMKKFTKRDQRGEWNDFEDGTFAIRLSAKVKTQSELSWIFLHELLHHVVYDSLHKTKIF